MSAPLETDINILKDPEKVLQLDECFRELRDSSAWKQVVALMQGQCDAVVRQGLSDYDKPKEVARRAGYLDAMEFLIHLPETTRWIAKRLLDEKEAQQKVKAEMAAERQIPRHVISG